MTEYPTPERETEVPIPESVEQMCAQHLAIRAARIANDLRRLAERVEDGARRIDHVGKLGTPSYAVVAADVVHQVMNALPNLNMHGLITAAQDADSAKADTACGVTTEMEA